MHYLPSFNNGKHLEISGLPDVAGEITREAQETVNTDLVIQVCLLGRGFKQMDDL